MMTRMHRFLYLVTTLKLALLTASEPCPREYPFAYDNGNHCCRHNKEKDCGNLGKGCDGSFIGNSSRCCRGDEFVKCLKGPCENYGICTSEGCEKLSKTLSDLMNHDADPCEDFEEFTCGKFIKNTVIPDHESEVSALIGPPSDNIYQIGKKLLEEKPTEKSPFETDELARVFYQSCMNVNLIENAGLTDVKKIFKHIGGFPAIEGASWNGHGYHWWEEVPKLFHFGILPNFIMSLITFTDLNNTKSKTLYLDQPVFGVYRSYLIKGFNNSNVKEYYKLMAESAKLLGANNDTAYVDMKQALQFEIGLAKISTPAGQRADEVKLYNKKAIRELEGQPGFPPSLKAYLNKFLDSAGLPGIKVYENDTVLVRDPEYHKKLSKLLDDTPDRTIANYISWRAYHSVDHLLGSASRSLREEYVRKTQGIKKPLPRWRVCVSAVGFGKIEDKLTLPAGSLYVRHHFKEEDKEVATNMVQDIKSSFRHMLETNDWMEKKTNKKAIEKLDAMSVNVAYPDEVLKPDVLNKFFKDLKLTGSYFHNSLEISKFWIKYYYGILRNPVDKSHFTEHQWIALLNAFNVPWNNAIEFPAGFMQSPIFDPKLPMYSNYGLFGMVVGHEVTHGFDFYGRTRDLNGNMINWWDPETNQRYEERAKCIVDFYGNYKSEQVGLNVNGAYTEGENTADIGGLKTAYLAYGEYVKRHGPEGTPRGHSYTGKQLYWIRFAHFHCGKSRDQSLKNQILHGRHAPSKFRVLGSVSNNDYFAEDFECPSGSKMNPVKKCKIW